MASTTMTVSGTIELYGIKAGGKTSYHNIEISNSLIENGTINSVKVKASVRETKRISFARATGYIGYLNASGNRELPITISDIPRKNETAKTATYGPFTPVKYNGKYYIVFGAKNNMATLNDIDVDFYGIEIYIDYTPPSYTVTVKSSPAEGGTVSGGGSYESGKSATLKATPKTGYRFVKWNDDVTTNPRTITVTGNATYTAYFEQIPPPKFTSVEIKYLDKQVSPSNKVIVNESFIISVSVT